MRAIDAVLPLVSMDNVQPELLDELLDAVATVAHSGAFVGGEEIDAFEHEFAAYCEARNAVAVSSGTAALMLVLRALEIGPGDEVVVPANTFIATAEAVSHVGATPRFVDVDPSTHTVSAQTVAGALGPRTRAIVCVHLRGRTADVAPLLALAAPHAIHLIEDACQAHGARYGGRRVGALGTAGCFSFYPAKNLGAWGDGGAVVTDDTALADRVRLLRSHGERPRYHHQLIGGTERLDAIQAAILRIKLRRLDGWNERRREIAAWLDDGLAGSGARTPAPASHGGDHVYHHYVVTHSDRDALRRHLAAAGISTGIHYPVPLHLTEAYRQLDASPGVLPVSEWLSDTIISLPMGPFITGADVDRIADAIHSFGH